MNRSNKQNETIRIIEGAFLLDGSVIGGLGRILLGFLASSRPDYFQSAGIGSVFNFRRNPDNLRPDFVVEGY
jgi:hypothetical protein